jgi:hypothetical protein
MEVSGFIAVCGMANRLKESKTNRKIVTRIDCCPKCSVHFSKKKTKVVYKEVVECMWCGFIWILRSIEEFEKYEDL